MGAEMDQVRSARIAILLIFLAALAVYTFMLRYRSVESPPSPDMTGIPTAIGEYESTDAYQPAEALRLLGADATVFRTYRNNTGRTIWLFLGYFGTQQENSQIHSPKHCYPGAGWDIVEEGTLRLGLPGSEASVKHLVISDGREQREVVYWFDTRSGVITDEFALKWYQMKNALLQRPQAAAFVRFSTGVSPDAPGHAREELVHFIEAISPRITETLRGRTVPAAESKRKSS